MRENESNVLLEVQGLPCCRYTIPRNVYLSYFTINPYEA